MNNIWEELVDRAEITEMFDRDLTDAEWENMMEALDDAVAGVLAEFL